MGPNPLQNIVKTGLTNVIVKELGIDLTTIASCRLPASVNSIAPKNSPGLSWVNFLPPADTVAKPLTMTENVCAGVPSEIVSPAANARVLPEWSKLDSHAESVMSKKRSAESKRPGTDGCKRGAAMMVSNFPAAAIS